MPSNNSVASARRFIVHATIAAFALLGTSCGGEGPVEPPPSSIDCGGVNTDVLSIAPLQGVTIRGAALACLALPGDGASYILAPQLLSPTLPYAGFGYRLGTPPGAATQRLSAATPPIANRLANEPTQREAQQRFDALLRAQERRIALMSRRTSVRRAPTGIAANVISPAAPDQGTIRRFSVLSELEEPLRFQAVDAELRYAGDHLLVYIDTAAAATLTAGDVDKFGQLFDQELYQVDRDTFGAESDVDANGRVIVLLSPVVNALVSTSECATLGSVRGFFFSYDLSSTDATSNAGELFYGYVPDPTGRWSCSHSKAEVTENLPPTFIHEFQHMISYGEHVLARGGESEQPWLNEGMSHLAEELGSIYFEKKYPAPAGRTSPTQIFPDSSDAFITPNLYYAHRYLFLSNAYSASSCAPGTFCTLPERAATWLFLRWLGDQKGVDVFRKLEQTSSVGAANVEGAAGESMASLFGDFTIALWADSIPGMRRDAVSPRHRFVSRNFRTLFRALYLAYGPIGGVGRPFPIEPLEMAPGEAITGTMRPGTFMMHRLTIPRGAAPARLRLSSANGELFPESSGAQLSIFRMPDP